MFDDATMPFSPIFWRMISPKKDPPSPGNDREFHAISAQLTAPSMHTMDGKHYAAQLPERKGRLRYGQTWHWENAQLLDDFPFQSNV